MDISGTTNVSSIHASNASFDDLTVGNIIIPDSSLTKSKITDLNTSLNNLRNNITTLNTCVVDLSNNITTLNTCVIDLPIDFVDPDGVNVNINTVVTIPHVISYFHPDTNDVEMNEINGLKYIEIPYNIYFESIRGDDLVIYDTTIDKRTVTIPDVIEFVDENNQYIVSVSNGIRTVTIPSQIN